MEKAIREAQERGEFDDLPGAGKPLTGLGANQTADPDWWVKGLVRREQLDMTGAMPPAVALRKERAGFPESLAGLRTEESVRAVLEDFNHRVRLDRLRPATGPFPPLLAPTVDVDEVVGQWRRLREEADGREAAVGRGAAAPEDRELSPAAGTSRAARPVRAAWIRRLLGRS